MTGTISIRVLFFARLAEAAGSRDLALSIKASATVGDALDLLAQRYPALGELGPALAVALNESYARRADALSDGDVLALIPPVSGG